MLAEIAFLLLAVTVAALIAVDMWRTPSDGPHGQADRLAHAVDHSVTSVPRDAASPPFTESPASPVPAAVRGPDRRAEAISPPAAGPSAVLAVPKKSGRELRNASVRSRLLLLVLVPAVTVTAVALAVVRIVDTVTGAPSGSAGDKAMLSALSVGVLVIIIVAVWFTMVVARSVLQPLRTLQAGAAEAAQIRLPDASKRTGQAGTGQGSTAQGIGRRAPSAMAAMDVDSSDEIGEIARAVDQMRREMTRLAVNEAALRGRLDAMFVNLSHRSQTLAERQIRLLDQLEQGEQDAERMASLVKMNRLAARMHRNAQNLLVMAGHEPPSGWNQPVALVNVIRAAVSEIEGAERASVNAQPDVAVRGPAVNDVVHLLAELTENAASFSAPDMPVDISGRLLTSGVLVAITDRGIGMAAKEMAYANWQLENPPTADINVPKWMGLLVVARLAARHGIRVRLQPAEFGGLVALVWLPDEVVTGQGAAASPGPGGFREPAPPREEPRDDTQDAPPARRLDPGVRPGAGLPAPSQAPQPQLASAPPGTAAPASAEEGSASAETGSASAEEGSASAEEGSASAEEGSADGSVIVPPAAEMLPGTGRLPIFDEVESAWFHSGHQASGPSVPATVAGTRWSSPADEGWRAAAAAGSPSSGGSTAAGLPRRLPNTNLFPGVIQATQPAAPARSAAAARDRLAGFQRGVSQARAASSEAGEATPEGEPYPRSGI